MEQKSISSFFSKTCTGNKRPFNQSSLDLKVKNEQRSSEDSDCDTEPDSKTKKRVVKRAAKNPIVIDEMSKNLGIGLAMKKQPGTTGASSGRFAGKGQSMIKREEGEEPVNHLEG